MFGKVQFEELESDILEKKCFQGENLDSNIGLRLFSRSARLQVRLCFPTLGAGERRPVSKVWSHPCAAAYSALSPP